MRNIRFKTNISIGKSTVLHDFAFEWVSHAVPILSVAVFNTNSRLRQLSSDEIITLVIRFYKLCFTFKCRHWSNRCQNMVYIYLLFFFNLVGQITLFRFSQTLKEIRWDFRAKGIHHFSVEKSTFEKITNPWKNNH